jgi:hypothetical protein
MTIKGALPHKIYEFVESVLVIYAGIVKADEKTTIDIFRAEWTHAKTLEYETKEIDRINEELTNERKAKKELAEQEIIEIEKISKELDDEKEAHPRLYRTDSGRVYHINSASPTFSTTPNTPEIDDDGQSAPKILKKATFVPKTAFGEQSFPPTPEKIPKGVVKKNQDIGISSSRSTSDSVTATKLELNVNQMANCARPLSLGSPNIIGITNSMLSDPLASVGGFFDFDFNEAEFEGGIVEEDDIEETEKNENEDEKADKNEEEVEEEEAEL